jgi:fructokinase
MKKSEKKKNILSIGEILWDSFPKGLFLGGAPFNVACHLNMLGENCTMISRIGSDSLGKQVLSRLEQKNMSSEFIQIDSVYKTGLVNVYLDSNGNATYDIVEPAAWDFIELNENLVKIAEVSDILIFGSLAQRNSHTRSAIRSLKKIVPLTVFDINLRPPYDNPDIVKESLKQTTIVKLNDTELLTLAKWFNLPSNIKNCAEALSNEFNCKIVCVTRGEKGAALWHSGTWSEHPGFKVKVKDTVGAGDAFLSALISGVALGDFDGYEVLKKANAVGAFVASSDGATPLLSEVEINAIMKN